jgi:hypothetical protein
MSTQSDASSAGRVALNARVRPELQRRLRTTATNSGDSVQDVVERQLLALLDSIDVAGVRAGTATPPGTARNGRGAETVALTVRIRGTLKRRMEALAAVAPGVSIQGLTIEALEALPDGDPAVDTLWAVLSGESVAPEKAKPAATIKKAAVKKAAVPKKATKPTPVRKAAPKKSRAPKRPDVVARGSESAEAAEIASGMDLFRPRSKA